VIYDASLDELLQKVWDGQRINQADALRLYHLPLEELGALANAFPHEVTVGNSKVSLRRVSLALVPGGGLALSGTASAGGTSYSGTVSGPVAFEDGHVVAAGPLSLDAQGLTIPAAQTQSAAQLLLAYVNGYLAAAPGLKIASASVGADGVHVTGTAPDTIAY